MFSEDSEIEISLYGVPLHDTDNDKVRVHDASELPWAPELLDAGFGRADVKLRRLKVGGFACRLRGRRGINTDAVIAVGAGSSRDAAMAAAARRMVRKCA